MLEDSIKLKIPKWKIFVIIRILELREDNFFC